MIEIREGIPKRIPGITSLFAKIIFDKNVIDIKAITHIFKQCDVFHYSPKTYIWELPLSSLSFLIDNLIFLDDIKITVFPEVEKERRRYPKLTYSLEPFKHQLEAIEYGLNKNNWLLLDAPGLGKTKSIIHLAEELREQEGLKHCLIICGVNILKNNWKEEIKKHSKLSSIILGEKVNSNGRIYYSSVKERAQQLMNPIEEFFIITNIETFRDNDVLQAFNNSENSIDMVAIDEIHKSKNPQSQQGKNILKLTKPKYKIGITGTLLVNSPLDAYMPLRWIGAENSSLSVFKRYYCNLGGVMGAQIIGLKNMDQLKTQIESNSLRRTKDLLNLPDKMVIHEVLEMEDSQKKFYQDIENGVKASADKVELKRSSILSLVTRLRQATACPSILTSGNIPSSKIDRAVDLAEQVISNGDKIVIFSTFKESVYVLQRKLEKYSPILITGDQKDDEVFEGMTKFQTDDNYKLVIATWQKGGTGLTFTAANYAIFIDSPWTAAEAEQSEDRIHRIGTDKSVFIYYLWCKDTIDMRVKELLESKAAVSDYIIDDHLDAKSIDILKNYIEDL